MRRFQTYPTRQWEQVAEGETVPRVELDMTFTRLVRGATSAVDYTPFHHDPEFARATGHPNIFVNTSFFENFIDRVLADWAGPCAFLTRRKLWMQQSVYAGDTMYCEGTVTRKWVDDRGRCLVDVDLVVGNQDGPRCPANATLWLPSQDHQ